MQNFNQFDFFLKLNVIYIGNVYVFLFIKYQYFCMLVFNIDINLIQIDKGNSLVVIKIQEVVDIELGERIMG